MDNTYYFWVFAITIVAIRLLLITRRVHSPAVFGYQMHHYMYGIVMIMVALFISHRFLYALGLAFFLDEAPQLITRGWTWADYYSVKNMLGVVIIVVIIYFSRNFVFI